MMPVEVDWSKNDTSLLGRFWDGRPAEKEQAAAIADRVMVYHRGINEVRFMVDAIHKLEGSYLGCTTVCTVFMHFMH